MNHDTPRLRSLPLLFAVASLGACGIIKSGASGPGTGQSGKATGKTLEAKRERERSQARARAKGTWIGPCEKDQDASTSTLTGRGSTKTQLVVSDSTVEVSEFMHSDANCTETSYVRRSTAQVVDFQLDGEFVGLDLAGKKARNDLAILAETLVPLRNWQADCGVSTWVVGEFKPVGVKCELWDPSPGSVLALHIAPNGVATAKQFGLVGKKGPTLSRATHGGKALIPVVFRGNWMEACENRYRNYYSYQEPDRLVFTAVKFHDDACTAPSFGLRSESTLQFDSVSAGNGVNFSVSTFKESIIPYGSKTAAEFAFVGFRDYKGWKAGVEHVVKAAPVGGSPLSKLPQAFHFFPTTGPVWGETRPEPGTPDFAAYDDAAAAGTSPIAPPLVNPGPKGVQPQTPVVLPTDPSIPNMMADTPAFEGQVTLIRATASAHTHSVSNVLLTGRKVQSACRLGSATFAALDDSERGVYRSPDGGRKWFKVATGLRELACSTHDRVFGLDAMGKLVESNDAGRRWRTSTLIPTFVKMLQAPNGRVVALSTGGSFTFVPETPSGLWSTRNDPTAAPRTSFSHLGLSPNGNLSITYSGESTSYHYDFASNTAGQIAPQFPSGSDALVRSVVFGDSQKGLLGYWNVASQRMALKATIDGGAQWIDRLTSAQVATAFGSDDRYMFEHLTNTSDGGYLTVGDVGGASMGLRISTDHGATWMDMAPPIPAWPVVPNSSSVDFDIVKTLVMTGTVQTGSGLLLNQKWSSQDSQLVLFDPK